jgi:nucleotide-binding universal stress UspA family protein
VPTDFGVAAEGAVTTAVELAKKFDSRITLAHVFAPPVYAYADYMLVDVVLPLQDAARQALGEAFTSLESRHPVSDSLLLQGDADTEILAAIDKLKADLVVMGTHGRKGVSRLFLGSVAARLVRESPVPVLTVREMQKS